MTKKYTPRQKFGRHVAALRRMIDHYFTHAESANSCHASLTRIHEHFYEVMYNRDMNKNMGA